MEESKLAKLRASVSNFALTIRNTLFKTKSSTTKKQNPQNIWRDGYSSANWTYIATAISFGIWFAVWLYLSSTDRMFDFSSLWVGMGIGYIFFSLRWWRPVREDEIAARIFFGKDAGDVGPGPPFAPLGLIRIRPAKVNVIQREIPGEPEKVYHGDLKDAKVDLAGKVVPIRIPFRNSITMEQAETLFGKDALTVISHNGEKVTFSDKVPDDGLGQRITAEPSMFVRLKPKNAYQFFRVLGGDVDVAMRQIEDEMVTTLKEFAANMSYAQAVANLRWLNIRLYQTIERRVGSGKHEVRDGVKNEDSWGLDLIELRVKSINLDHSTNEAIRDAAKVSFEAKSVTVRAVAEREALILRGEGAARAARELEEQTLFGRAAGQKKIAEDLGLTGEQVQAAEVARELARGGGTVILGPDGLTQLGGVIGAMVNKKPQKKIED